MSALPPACLTGRLLKAARVLSGLSVSELAAASGLSVITIKRAEAVEGALTLRGSTAEAIISALSDHGVRFLMLDSLGNEVGVSVRPR